MLINRNRLPIVNIFKHSDVMDSYVSRNETNGILAEIESKLITHKAMINDNIGFDYSAAPREAIKEISKNIFSRHPLVDNVYGLTKREDNSLASPDILSSDRYNNLLGYITSDNINNTDDKTAFSNIAANSYAKIAYEERTPEDLTKFNPFVNYSLTDAVRIFLKNNIVYTIHRGGYITIRDITTQAVRVVNIIQKESLFSENFVKNEIFFNQIDLNNLVTNADFNNNSSIVITTMMEEYIFDLNNESCNKIDVTLIDETVIDVKFYDNKIYFIISNNIFNYKIKVYNTSTQELIDLSIDKDSTFFPNSIVKIGLGIYVYESINKFGKHIDNSIKFIKLSESNVCNIQTYTTPVEVKISSMVGVDENAIQFFIKSDDILFNNSIITLTDDLFLLDKNICTINSNINKIKMYDSGITIISSEDDISFFFFDNFISQVVSINKLGLTKHRNTGNYIVDFSTSGANFIVLFDDNTYRIIPITSIKKKSLYTTDRKNIFSYEVLGVRTIITNDKIYTITDGNISTMIVTPHTSLFDQIEYDNVSIFHYQFISDTITNVVFVTKSNSFTRFTMMQIEYTNGIPDLSILSTSGINSIVKFDTSLIRINMQKFLIPVLTNSSKLFLVVCDFTKSIIVKNYLQTTEEYSKSIFLNIDCSRMSIGIGSTVYDCDTVTSLFDTPFQANESQDIDPNIFIQATTLTLPVSRITQNYAAIKADGSYDFNLHSFNNINLNNISKHYTFDNYHIFVSNKDIKIFNSSFVLISICDFDSSEILTIEEENEAELILKTSIGDIYINEDISTDIVDTILFKNKSINYISVDNSDYIILNDNFTISIIDNVYNKYYYDILNELVPDDILLNDSIHSISIDSAKMTGDYLYIGISIRDTNNCYIGSFIIVFNLLTEIVNFYSLVDHIDPVIDESICKVNTKFIDMALINGEMKVLFYFDSRIKCATFIDGSKAYTTIIFSIPNNVTYLAMNCIDSDNNVYILTSDETVHSTDYTAKDLIYPSKVLLSDFYFVDVINKEKFKYVISKIDNIKYISKSLIGGVIYSINTTTPSTIFQYIQSNFKDLTMNTSIADAYLYNKNKKECIKINVEGIFNFTNGYYLFNYKPFLLGYNSNLFFTFFTNGFVSFNNLSGMMYFKDNMKISTVGNRIVKDIDTILEFEVNKLSCIKNNKFNKLVDSIKGYEDNSVQFYSDIFMVQTIVNGNDSKYLNYLIDDGFYTILFSDSKPISVRNSQLLYLPDLTVENTSHIYKEMENNTAVILGKKDDAVFGYSQCIFIDSSNSYHTIDMNDGFEIKPIFVDTNGILHSIVKNGDVTIYMYGTSVVNSVVIDSFENVADAIKIPEIINSILLTNVNGDLIIFDTGDYNNGLKYKTINFTSDDIIGLPTNYSFIRIITLNDNFTATIIVKNNQTNKLNIISDCRLTLTLDVFGLPFFEVITTYVGVIKNYYFDNNADTNKYVLPNTNNNFGLSFVDCIKTIESNINDINITVHIGKIPIDSEFVDTINPFVDTFTTRDKSIPPAIFIRKGFFIVQYGKNIDIFEITDLSTPNFIPLYRIKQNDNVITKQLIDVGINNNNHLILSFNDKTARVIDIKKSIENNSQVTVIDTDFHFYKEYKPLSYNDDIKWFITEIGIVGYVSDNDCYIYTNNGFQHVPTSNEYIKFFCIDPIYGRVYTVDDLDNFGYIDIKTLSYIPVKALTEMDVKGLVFTQFNTVEILTTVGIFIYVNEILHKINNINPDGYDLIVYPFREYSI